MAYGKLTVVAGPMYAGKTSEILKRILWARSGQNQIVHVYKPAFDTRYSNVEIVNHDGLRTPARSISEWPVLDETPDLIVVDEVQFFDEPHFKGDLVDIIGIHLRQGIDVLASGLDTDWQGQPFYVTSMLLGMADEVHKPKAICTTCGRPAGKTFKKSESGETIELGATDKYEARCNEHWKV